MHGMKSLVLGAAALVLAAALPHSAGHAADISYQGKKITLVIGFSMGGTYGLHAQLMSDFYRRHLPDDPTIIVQSMPGAGGIKMLNYAANVMPRDGTYIFMPADTTVVSQLLRPENVRFDARKFSWLGSADQTNVVWMVRTATGVKSWEDLRTKQIVSGNSGPGGVSYLIPRLADELLGLKIKHISGYDGSRPTIMAMERGEVDASAFTWLSWATIVPHWFEKGKETAIPILQVGVNRDPAIPDVPMLGEVVDDKDKRLVSFISTLGIIGRGLALPPGVPAEYTPLLRSAFEKMIADPTYQAEAKKRQLRLQPVRGEELQKLVGEAFEDADSKTVERARQIIFGDRKS